MKKTFELSNETLDLLNEMSESGLDKSKLIEIGVFNLSLDSDFLKCESCGRFLFYIPLLNASGTSQIKCRCGHTTSVENI